jgi:hypothetical protein
LGPRYILRPIFNRRRDSSIRRFPKTVVHQAVIPAHEVSFIARTVLVAYVGSVGHRQFGYVPLSLPPSLPPSLPLSLSHHRVNARARSLSFSLSLSRLCSMPDRSYLTHTQRYKRARKRSLTLGEGSPVRRTPARKSLFRVISRKVRGWSPVWVEGK